MSLQQRGRDTDRIDLLYRIHYLQWTGHAGLDRVLGAAGLALVLALTLLGARLAFRIPEDHVLPGARDTVPFEDLQPGAEAPEGRGRTQALRSAQSDR